MSPRGARLAAVALGVTVVAWTATGALPLPVRLWTAVLLAVLPALLVMQAAELPEAADMSRLGLYASTGFSLWLLALATALAAWAGGWGLADLLLTPVAPRPATLWAIGVMAAAVAVFAAARVMGVRESPLTAHLLPVTPRERGAFVALSLTAGCTEELIFRGFLLTALVQATGSSAAAVLLSSAVFGIVHGYQGVAGAVRPALLGLLLAASAVATGSILPAMVAHAGVDILSGLWLGHRLIR